jgi:hypothetical protein
MSKLVILSFNSFPSRIDELIPHSKEDIPQYPFFLRFRAGAADYACFI